MVRLQTKKKQLLRFYSYQGQQTDHPVSKIECLSVANCMASLRQRPTITTDRGGFYRHFETLYRKLGSLHLCSCTQKTHVCVMSMPGRLFENQAELILANRLHHHRISELHRQGLGLALGFAVSQLSPCFSQYKSGEHGHVKIS